jgi:hypothetical protein
MTQSSRGSIETISHQVDRHTIQIDDPFEQFRNRYKRAVPVFESERFDSLVERGVDWQCLIVDAIVEYVAAACDLLGPKA